MGKLNPTFLSGLPTRIHEAHRCRIWVRPRVHFRDHPFYAHSRIAPDHLHCLKTSWLKHIPVTEMSVQAGPSRDRLRGVGAAAESGPGDTTDQQPREPSGRDEPNRVLRHEVKRRQ
jgi:hypothetical protein